MFKKHTSQMNYRQSHSKAWDGGATLCRPDFDVSNNLLEIASDLWGLRDDSPHISPYLLHALVIGDGYSEFSKD